MPYIKKSPIQEKLWELANEVPGAKYVLPDPYEATSYLMPVGGLTKQGVSKVIVNKLFDPTLSPILKEGLRKDFADLLRVVAATPKRAIAHVKEFKLIPGKTTGGAYHPEAINVFSHADVPSSMAGTYGHEAVGHGAGVQIGGQVRMRQLKKLGMTPGVTPEEVGIRNYTAHPEAYEGAAEYLGNYIQEKAGITPSVWFGHGEGQKEVFEELSKMPSKSPFMNVYRYFQKLIGK